MSVFWAKIWECTQFFSIVKTAGNREFRFWPNEFHSYHQFPSHHLEGLWNHDECLLGPKFKKPWILKQIRHSNGFVSSIHFHKDKLRPKEYWISESQNKLLIHIYSNSVLFANQIDILVNRVEVSVCNLKISVSGNTESICSW